VFRTDIPTGKERKGKERKGKERKGKESLRVREGRRRVDIQKFVGEFRRVSLWSGETLLPEASGKFEIAYSFFTRHATTMPCIDAANTLESACPDGAAIRSVEIEQRGSEFFASPLLLDTLLFHSGRLRAYPSVSHRFVSSLVFDSRSLPFRSWRRLTYRFQKGGAVWPSPPCLRGPKVLASSVPPFFIPRGRPPSSLTPLPLPRRHARSLSLSENRWVECSRSSARGSAATKVRV